MTPGSPTPRIEVRRADERFTASLGPVDSKHSFSFGRHYDPANTHHGVLLVNNEIVLAPGAGFDAHPHRDMEIVTWVLRGSLVHRDSTGHCGVVYPGLAQRMSAGTGVVHSEVNASQRRRDGDGPSVPVHLVQMWVAPDKVDSEPSYEQREVSADMPEGRLVPIVSGLDEHANAPAIGIGNRHAALHVARLRPGGSVELPRAPYLHLFVPRGAVALHDAGALSAGDAARLHNSGGQQVTASSPAEILVWEMHATLTP